MDPAAYPLLDTFDLPAVEEQILAQWEAEDAFAQSLAARAGAPPFVFYEGPPTANGRPGIHHVMARTVKDLFCRYKTMRGFHVDRRAGWDTHGLPVEIEVEKELGLKGREEIEAYGIAKYNAACRASVLRYKDLWDRLTARMGYWVDLENPYVTFHNDYIESVWHLLQTIHTRGLLSRGQRVQWYSPASGTVLSSHEVSLGYREMQDPGIVVRARLVQDERTSLLAWTTTPWTVPGNAAMAVGEHIRYVRVRQTRADDGTEEFLILAAARAPHVLKGDYEIVDEFAGRDLVGQHYMPLWEHTGERTGPGHAWRVVAADYVTTDDGTGIVHTAPAFGADDFATGERESLPLLNAVGPDGTFEAEMPLIGGMGFKEADRTIIRHLAEQGLIYREDSYVHNYPHDWRRGTPLMQYPVEGWFIKTTAVKDRMAELNRQVNWQPEGVGTGRFGQWLENNVDWAVSRRRFWGTPLPIWVSDRDPEQVEVIGSVAELLAKVGGAWPEDALNPETGEIDLHRPYVDALTWPDGAGGTMRRVPDLVDVWFDSGAMPYAQWHYPFENAERFAESVPADLIAEGVDQTRGWFYTLHAIATLVDDRLAYKNVVVNGLVLDADGRKMSKSLGNAVDPFEAIERHGVDAVRWTMMSAAAPWDDLRYSDVAVDETRRKLFATVANTYRFFAQYATLDGYRYDAARAVPDAARTELDRWILSQLQATVAEATDALEAYHPTRAARAVEAFVESLSNWYLRRSRRRFWTKDAMGAAPTAAGSSKQAAYDTLAECLAAVAQLMAPIAPFTADWLWRALGHDASVHLATWPAPDAARADEALDARMAVARAVVTATLALRNDAGIGVRQPLPAVAVVAGPGGVDEAALRTVAPVILDEVNVKRLDVLTGADTGLTVEAKASFKALGRRLGPRMKAAADAIRALPADRIAEYEATGRLVLEIDGETVAFEPGDIGIVRTGAAGRAVRTEAVAGGHGTAVVMLDTALDADLIAEGVAREVVNRVQNLRKEAGLHVADRIHLTVAGPDEVRAAVEAHRATVMGETLAVALDTPPVLAEPVAPEADAPEASTETPAEARTTARLSVAGQPAEVALALRRADA